MKISNEFRIAFTYNLKNEKTIVGKPAKVNKAKLIMCIPLAGSIISGIYFKSYIKEKPLEKVTVYLCIRAAIGIVPILGSIALLSIDGIGTIVKLVSDKQNERKRMVLQSNIKNP